MIVYLYKLAQLITIYTQVYSNPEDIKARYGDNAKIKPIFDDPDVERARR